MSRKSAFRGTWQPNRRPYIVMTPDVYVAFQGETSVIGCGECLRQISINDYVTGISTEASVDSPPGSATINLSIPDNDVNEFYVDGQFLIIPMMEVEIYAKGYFLVGGFPQYYKVFWGLVSSVSKSWSGGTTTITISCKDILRWWELTNTTTNPAFVDGFGSSTGNFSFWGNQFAGMNPYTVIIHLAREAMGDFSLTTGSFTSFLPEKGPEGQVIASFAKDIMAYWQLKFANIWNSLVMFGTSGQAYTFHGDSGTFSPNSVSAEIFKEENKKNFVNQETQQFRIQPQEIAAFKQELDKAATVEFFQSDSPSKLSIAMTARDQAGYEFYCDTTGDIIFKPPFYNLNVMPNKPVSWVQDFEIIEDTVSDSEAEVYTHITSSGNAFGGTMDWGLNDEITTPRAGAFDFHLLRRYGWRKYDYQCEWAGNPRKLFFHLIDYLDRLNAKRQNGTVTIPMRPEIRMGFPVWIPKYDAFFYIQGISHQFSVGGQATTTLTLIAKRSKFIAPNNIGTLKQTGVVVKNEVLTPEQKKKGQKASTRKEMTYSVSFPDRVGTTTGVSQDKHNGEPVIIRDPKTGRLLGYPNVVMVFRAPHDGVALARIVEKSGEKIPDQGKTPKTTDDGTFTYKNVVSNTFKQLLNENRGKLIDQLRAHRYESGMTNAGAYDYAFDESRSINELLLVPMDSVTWPSGGGGDETSTDGASVTSTPGTVGATAEKDPKKLAEQKKKDVADQTAVVKDLQTKFDVANKAYVASKKKLDDLKKARDKKAGSEAKGGAGAKRKPTKEELVAAKTLDVFAFEAAGIVIEQGDTEITDQAKDVIAKKKAAASANQLLIDAKSLLAAVKSNKGPTQRFAALNMIVRPVSDDFGFEVIGHYKYGRGSFIDRGQLKIGVANSGLADTSLANQLNVQFAPSGGFLTDTGIASNSDPAMVSFADAFEKMQPEDYTTGASFKGYVTGKGGPSDVVQTTQNTYTNLIQANVGRSSFVEADALRRSKTLGELAPTIGITGLDQAFQPCDCGLGRSTWLGLLPADVLATILGDSKVSVQEGRKSADEQDPARKEAVDKIDKEIDDAIDKKQVATLAAQSALNKQRNKKGAKPADVEKIDKQIDDLQKAQEKFNQQQEESRAQRKSAVPQFDAKLQSTKNDAAGSVFTGHADAGSFFDALTAHLQKTFKSTYESSNAPRELYYTVQDRNIERSIPDPSGIKRDRTNADIQAFEGNEENNILGDPSDPLFDAASKGDPDALAALQQKANFNFGGSKKALDNLSKAWETGKSTINALDFHPGPAKDILSGSVSSGHPAPQTQPDTTPLPLPTVLSSEDAAKLRYLTVATVVLNKKKIDTAVIDSGPATPATAGPVPDPGKLAKIPHGPAAARPQVVTAPKKA